MNSENPSTEPVTSPDILSEYDIGYQYATTGQRFLNFLIDSIIIRFTLVIGITIGFYVLVSPEFVERSLVFATSEYFILTFGVGYTSYIFYYTLCEKLFNGRTLGKLITGTKAVTVDGNSLTFKDALLRSLCRIVPFEPFSGFGTPWHDSWTNTTVIKMR